MVRCKGAGRRTTIKRLHDRRLDLQEVVLVHEAAHGPEQTGTGAKHSAHFGIDSQVGVTLAVTLFLVGKGAVALQVAIDLALFHQGQWAEGFAEHAPALGVQADLTHARAEHLATGFHKVAQVDELAEVEVGFFVYFTAPQEELHPAGAVFDVGEDGPAHVAHTDHPAGEGNGDFIPGRGALRGLKRRHRRSHCVAAC